MSSLHVRFAGLAVAFVVAILVPAAVLVTTAFNPGYANETIGTVGIGLATIVFVGAILAIFAYGDRLRASLADLAADT